MNKEDNI
jgi:hypothetical protein